MCYPAEFGRSQMVEALLRSAWKKWPLSR